MSTANAPGMPAAASETAAGGKVPHTVAAALSAVAGPAEAQAFTRGLAHSHYENFSVVSTLLPRHLRQDFCNVYAFCRVADDAGDETGDPELSLRLLNQLRAETAACFDGNATSAAFVALAETVRRHAVPIEPFLDLIDAFEQDQRVTRYPHFDAVVDYCRRSADPVGRIVLHLCDCRAPQQMRLSDKTCTALQLANFWQDVRADLLERDRIYLPQDSMERFGVTEAQIRDGRCDEAYRNLLRFEVDRAAEWFDAGDALLPTLPRSVRPQIALFGKGGRAILDAIRARNYDTLTRRPTLSRWAKGRLVISVLLHSLISSALPGTGA